MNFSAVRPFDYKLIEGISSEAAQPLWASVAPGAELEAAAVSAVLN